MLALRSLAQTLLRVLHGDDLLFDVAAVGLESLERPKEVLAAHAELRDVTHAVLVHGSIRVHRSDDRERRVQGTVRILDDAFGPTRFAEVDHFVGFIVADRGMATGPRIPVDRLAVRRCVVGRSSLQRGSCAFTGIAVAGHS